MIEALALAVCFVLLIRERGSLLCAKQECSDSDLPQPKTDSRQQRAAVGCH